MKSAFERLKELTEKHPGRGLYMNADFGAPGDLILGFDEIIRLWRFIEVVQMSGVVDVADRAGQPRYAEIRAWLDAVTKVRT